MAKYTAYTRREEAIKQAAIDCLPMLLMNCSEVEAARMLLRASQPEKTDTATLLGPASGANPVGANELLRGADAPETQE